MKALEKVNVHKKQHACDCTEHTICHNRRSVQADMCIDLSPASSWDYFQPTES